MRRIQAFISLFLAGSLGACAVGVTPPTTTPMVLIDDGLSFKFGSEAPCLASSPDGDPCEGNNLFNSTNRAPQVWVQLTPFFIDAHEVTNVQYEYCEAMGACPTHNIVNAVATSQAKYHLNDPFDAFPVVQVNYSQAEAYCAFVGKRLPTEFEWERAALGNPDALSGETHRLYPAEGVGDNILLCKSPLKLPTKYCRNNELEAVPTAAALSGDDSGPSDHVIEENSSGETFTIYHMFGNVAEWTSTFYQPDITCQDSSYTGACQSCWDCPDNACKETCNVCPDCPQGDCSYLCTGPDDDQTWFQCQAPESSKLQPIAQKELSPTTGNHRVIRGGSVNDGTTSGCRARSSARDRVNNSESLLPDRTTPYVGFRCVKDS